MVTMGAGMAPGTDGRYQLTVTRGNEHGDQYEVFLIDSSTGSVRVWQENNGKLERSRHLDLGFDQP